MLETNGTIYSVSDLDYIEVKWEYEQLKHKKKFFYNQNLQRRTRNACWIYWPLTALSHLKNYQFSLDEILDCVNLAEKSFWWKEDSWMFMNRWVDCVRNWWNTKFPNDKIDSFRTQIWSDVFYNILDAWYSIVVWHTSNRTYIRDSQDNWVIDNNNRIKWNFWHLLSAHKDWQIKIDDNYIWQKDFNTWENRFLVDLQKSWLYFPSAYYFLNHKDMTIRNWIDIEGAKLAYDKWYWNGRNPQAPMTRQEVMAVINRVEEANRWTFSKALQAIIKLIIKK